MNEKIRKIITPVKEFWGKIGKKTKIIGFSALGAIALVAIVAVAMLNTKEYVVLYTGLDETESSEVITALTDRAVDFQMKGSSIEILKSDEALIRMQLAAEGHPRTAPNFDYFTTNIDITTTDFEKRKIDLQQLIIRLEASIKSIKGINNAKVQIDIPENNTYAFESDKKVPTASVLVDLLPGIVLTPQNVNAIKTLVYTSVAGMKAENVGVVDTAGNELESSGGTAQTDISRMKLEIEATFEKNIKAKILNILTPVYGADNVYISAKSSMDIDKKIKEIITYTPSTEDGKGMTQKEHTIKENVTGANGVGGVPGAEDNTEEVPNYPGVTVDGNNIYIKDEKSYDYLVNQVKEQIESSGALLKDMTIGITINQGTMTEVEKNSLKEVVAYGAAIDPAKVSIFNKAFPKENILTPPTVNPILLITGVSVAGLLLILLLLVILMNNAKKKKMKAMLLAAEQEAQSQAELLLMQQQVAGDTHVSLNGDETEETKEQIIKREIEEFTANNPQIAAQLIRTWLKGDSQDEY